MGIWFGKPTKKPGKQSSTKGIRSVQQLFFHKESKRELIGKIILQIIKAASEISALILEKI